MDLLPVILSIAQAEGPPSVLGQIIKAVMATRMWLWPAFGFWIRIVTVRCAEAPATKSRFICEQAEAARLRKAKIGAASTVHIIELHWTPRGSLPKWCGPGSMSLSLRYNKRVQ